MTGVPEDPRVLVLTRAGCHLCDDAAAIIDQVCREAGVGWRSQEITGDLDLTRQYGEQIPVTFVDGRQHDYWRVDPERLRAALARTPR